MKTRVDIIQELIAAKHYRCYLEIGVDRGDCFLKIAAPRKLAVDPCFRISRMKLLGACLRNPANFHNQYYRLTSDEFFARHGAMLGTDGLDIAFVDGAHTYAQSLADIQHCLEHLHPDGVILVHDCDPPSAAVAYPAPSFEAAIAANPPGWTGEWCGDVWKAMGHLRLTRPDLTVRVLDTDYGVGVVMKRPEPEPVRLDIKVEELVGLGFGDFLRLRRQLLGLCDVSILWEMIQWLQ